MSSTDAIDLPSTPLCRDVLQLVVTEESAPIAHHSIRSFLFAQLLVRQCGAAEEIDTELLFASCVLHDVGLTAAGDRHNRFEIDGADVAAEFLTAHGRPGAEVDAVWDAIALHSSPGLAERRSPLCGFTQRGIWADFGATSEFVTDEDAVAVHRGYPRLHLGAALADAVVAQALRRPEKAPRYSLADTLVQERRGPDRMTRMESDEPHSRWAGLLLEHP